MKGGGRGQVAQYDLEVIKKFVGDTWSNWMQVKGKLEGPVAKEPGPEHRAALASAFGFKGYIEKTEHRAITLRQLCSLIDFAAVSCHTWAETSEFSPGFGQPHDIDKLNLYSMNSWVILPATEAAGTPRQPATQGDAPQGLRDCAMVEMLAEAAQVAKWFISHWWGEAIMDFIKCMSFHIGARHLSLDDGYWVCAYANRQHSLASEVTADPRETSFFKAMQLADGVLLILDAKTEDGTGPATPFTRIWCAFEESTAISFLKIKLDIATCYAGSPQLLTDGVSEADLQKHALNTTQAPLSHFKTLRERTFPLEVIQAGLTCVLEQAKASMGSDRVHILNAIAGVEDLEAPPLERHEKYEEVNIRLRSAFSQAAMPQAADTGSYESLGLISALAADRWCSSWTFDFTKADDGLAKALAKGMPPNLTSLEILFSELIPSDELRQIAMTPGAIKSGKYARKYIMEIRAQHSMTSDGLAAIAAALPAGLEALTLKFKEFPAIGDAGLTALAESFPAKLQSLTLAFQDCDDVRYAGLSALAAKIPASASAVSLDFRGRGATDAGPFASGQELQAWVDEKKNRQGPPSGWQPGGAGTPPPKQCCALQ